MRCALAAAGSVGVGLVSCSAARCCEARIQARYGSLTGSIASCSLGTCSGDQTPGDDVEWDQRVIGPLTLLAWKLQQDHRKAGLLLLCVEQNLKPLEALQEEMSRIQPLLGDDVRFDPAGGHRGRGWSEFQEWAMPRAVGYSKLDEIPSDPLGMSLEMQTVRQNIVNNILQLQKITGGWYGWNDDNTAA